ncbi:MAG: NAD(P)(+) transhydrogenase (Re/Si-specific) subunit beta [Eubacteriales bacterium]|nr:NAD(P)(+) transhydrogenase (Re/Si-specific) subunit beta [Eubacteriales bacterium]
MTNSPEASMGLVEMILDIGIPLILCLGVLSGIRLMSNVKTAVNGNRLSALCMLLAIIYVFLRTDVSGALVHIIAGITIGILVSITITVRVRMIQMPQMVGLLNGLGGLASALAAIITLNSVEPQSGFGLITSGLALAVGALTFSGSMVAAGKLQGTLPQRPRVYPGHQTMTVLIALGILILITLLPIFPDISGLACLLLSILGLLFGYFFAIRVGGADMPITISLLNSTSGVAAGIAGMALGDFLLVSVGGIVGASGLLLTRIMCRSMNRSLSAVLFGKAATGEKKEQALQTEPAEIVGETEAKESVDPIVWLKEARSVIIIPGYGMALSQAQEQVKTLADLLEAKGTGVRFAIHPVAGRMPGHMNVLLAEVDVPYDKLFEMEAINPDFAHTDLALVIGANDVVNPAANTAEGTPIYGMPVLSAEHAKRLMILNFDTKPGYAGVHNPLYDGAPNICMMLGDAKGSLEQLIAGLG